MENAYNFILNDINLKYGDVIVIGVSGGPDSMALLNLLVNIKKELDISVVVGHVNHNVRKESKDEAIFVQNFCLKNNVIFESMVIENYGDDNFHNEARSIRYNYFRDLVTKYRAKYLFTAHHGDDLIETVLMRIVRGSTLKGYSGFSKVVKFDNHTIVRPLINVTKNEILTYLKKNNISYVTDKSNEKDVYTRNRFRKYIVPGLKNEDKNVHEKFLKFSRNLLEYNDYVDRQAKKSLDNVLNQNVLNIPKFLKEEHIIQMKIIYYMLEQIYQDDLMLITDNHAELIYNLIISSKANAEIYLPNNIKGEKSYDNFVLVKDKILNNFYEIEIDNYAILPNGRKIEVISKTNLNSNDICRLNKNDVKFPLTVRNRREGDKMYVKGMNGRKKINDIFIDSKISKHDRDLWPVVVDSTNTIVWIPGLKKSKFDKQKDEKYDIILKYD